MISTAEAQQVPRAEHGAVPLLAAEPVGLEDPVTVARGATAWTEQLRAANVVRVLSDAVVRRRPGPLDGAKAGDFLIGVQLSSGVAYCPLIDFDAPSRRVQCYRDFNDDGTFDGGYVTAHDGLRTQIVPAMLRSLAAIPSVSYEPADPSNVSPVSAAWRFERWRRGTPEFRLWVEDERMETNMPCVFHESLEANHCIIADLLLEITPEDDDGATIKLAGQAAQRRMMIVVDGPLR